jgi:energy-coupling factor transport system permease protein
VRIEIALLGDPGAPIARRHPLAKLGAAALLMLALFLAVDVVTPLILLAVLVVAVPVSGLRPTTLLRRASPLLIAGLAIAILNTVFAQHQLGHAVHIGPVMLGLTTILGGLAVGLRIVGIALAGVLALATIEPTDLADALVQHLHAPPRFALGALAAVRMLPVLGDEWRLIGLARRARGMEAGRNPVAAVRLAAGRLFALLVAAIRRGTRLALAMDARGFGQRPCRTVARPRAVGRADWLLLGGALLAGLGATGVSLALGSYRLLFG